jgi:nucleotide-binding universal stress UspA family protein
VLVVFDGSPCSWSAARDGIELARGRNARIDIVAVLCNPPWLSLAAAAYTTMPVILMDQCAGSLLGELAALRDEVPADVSVTTRFVRSVPRRSLPRLLDAGSYDVVIGCPAAARLPRWARIGPALRGLVGAA